MGEETRGRRAALRHFSTDALDSAERVPVLVEFEQLPVVVYKARNPLATAMEVEAYAESLRAAHQQFIDSLRNMGVEAQVSRVTARVAIPGGIRTVEVVHDFTYLFNGVGMDLPGRMVERIVELPMVRSVTHNVERVYLNLDHSVAWVGAPKVWQLKDANGRPITGEGVTIAVIDTGGLWSGRSPGLS